MKVTDATIKAIQKQIGNVDGKTADEIKTAIFMTGKITFNQVNEVYKALGFTTKRVSLADEFHAELQKGPMSPEELNTWLKNTGSKNAMNHRGSYDKVRVLSNWHWNRAK